MAYDAFIKIDGIYGEATQKGFEKQIEVLSWSWGATNPEAGGVGTATMSAFTFLHRIDIASPKIFASLTQAQTPIPTATFQARKTTAKYTTPFVFFKLVFSSLYFVDLQLNGDGKIHPEESVKFTFQKVTESYIQRPGAGSVDATYP